MKLKLLIALAALVPSLVMAQARPNPTPTVSSTGQPGGFQPLPTVTTPGQVGANQQQIATNPSGTTDSSSGKSTSTNVGGIYMCFNSSGKSTSSTPANVGGKADKYGSSAATGSPLAPTYNPNNNFPLPGQK